MKDLTENKAIVIMALNTGSETKERDILESLGYKSIKPLNGVYKGQEELSWLIVLKKATDFKGLVLLAQDHNQESILYSERNRYSQLYYINSGSHVSLGILKQTTKGVAKTYDNYSHDPANDTYWITEGVA